MKPKPIIIALTGSLSQVQKKELSDSGYIVIMAERPEDVRLIKPSSLGFDADMLSMAALGAIMGNESSAERSAFVRLLFAALKDEQVKNENTK